MARTSSGSSVSACEVKPTRSAKRTVTTFRSRRSGLGASVSAAPQLPQKRKPSGLTVPQAGQVIGRSVCGDAAWVLALVRPAPEDDARVVAAEAERVRGRDLDLRRGPRLVGDVVEVAGRVLDL